MTLTDWIGSIGVTILLLAYFLNLTDRLSKESLAYIIMNLIGAGLACAASVLLKYLPFIILEGAWMCVSLYSLLTHHRTAANTSPRN
jgi:hypothetical protein